MKLKINLTFLQTLSEAFFGVSSLRSMFFHSSSSSAVLVALPLLIRFSDLKFE